MRIIAGEAGGRRIKAPDTRGTRPATDRVREAVFSAIGPFVDGSDVADLYAGSGSFGLEALSRGARSAQFVESSRRALEALRSNVEVVGLGGDVIAGTVDQFIDRCAAASLDLVFVDPPWSMGADRLGPQLAELDRLLRSPAQVVISRRSGDPTPDIPENWRVAADKRYGDTRILRYEKAESEDDG